MNNIDSAFKGTAGLTRDYYEALVAASMEPHRLAVQRAKARKDTLSIETAVYNDLDTKINALSNAIKALRQGDDSVFDDKLASSGDGKIVSASATSSAADAAYDINITQMAQAHRVRGDRQSSSTSDLGLSAGSFTINGVTVNITDGASLTDIRDAINTAVTTAIEDETISEEQGFNATIIDNQLVLTADSTGQDFALTVDADADGILENLGIWEGSATNDFANPALQTAQNAIFTVNNIEVTRNSNSSLDDVIEGVTLSLAGEGETTLTIAPNTEGVKNAVNTFMSRLNDFNTWLAAKTGVSENSDGSYTRGVLAGDYTLKSLRRELIQKTFATWSGAPVDAVYTRLDQLGLELGERLSVSLADADKLSTALATNYSDVVLLFDSMMEQVQALVDPYTEGTDNRVNQLKEAADDTLEIQNDRVKRLEDALSHKEEFIRDQIAMQFASISFYNDQGRFLMTTMYGGFSAYG
jgi:flagellar hook-associated protein 2